MNRSIVSAGRNRTPSAWYMFRAAVLTLVFAAFGTLPAAHAQAYSISSGSASLNITQGLAAAINTFDAYFDASSTRAQVLSLPAPGNASFTVSAPNVSLSDPIRPWGVVPLNDAGGTSPGVPGASRTRQATTLAIEDLSNVLGSWTTSTDIGAFVGNASSEQIAFSNMQRWTGPFTGSLVYGDFALRYTGTKLVLTSNIDFLNAAFADIGSPVINVTGNTLTISGNLLMGGGLNALDPTAIPGTPFGTFALTATLAAVPEPTSIALMGMVAVGVAGYTWRVRRQRQRNSRHY